QTADGLLALCQGLREAERAGLPVLLEVDWVQRRHGTLVSRAEDPHCLAALVGGVSGLGPSASRRWLELPRVEALGAAMKATTLPVLGLPPERRGPGLDAVPDYEPVPGLALQGQLLGR